jgi:carbonic anhydrase
MSDDKTMERLLKGFAKFQADVFPKQREAYEHLAGEQHPIALFITCADSRILPQVITQAGPGDLFICRNAGNMIPPYGELHGGVSATIEYAVLALSVPNIVVLGHSDCGAMKGVLNPETVADMPTVATWLRHADTARRMVKENYPNLSEEKAIEAITAENVIAQLENLKTHPSVAARLARGQIQLHGWLFHIKTGNVTAFDAERGRFVPLEGLLSAPHATPRSRNIMAV